MSNDDLERLSRLQAGDLTPAEEASLREEISARPELQVLLRRFEALDEAAAALGSESLDVEGAIARATTKRAPRRWPYVVLAAAAAIALGVWMSWPSDATAVPEQKKQQTLIAAVDAAQGTEHLEDEGARVSRLKNGTALYRGDWEVRVDEQTLLVRGVALISTNPSEAALHVTTLVTPTNEESTMIRNATKQWALAAGLSVFVLAGEVQADDGAVKAGQNWNKKTAAAPVKNSPKPAQLAQPQPTENPPKDGECGTCDPNNFVADNPVAQDVNIGNSPSMGPADAKVTVVLFSEAECSFCVKSHSVLKELQKIYAGKVRFVFKHFPLPVHAGARQAAIALHAAHAQGRFWEMVESAYGTPVSAEGGLYDAQARALGLDLQQYRRDVANPATAAVIDADIAEGKRLGVKGVPAWFINGKEIVGHRPLETMREAIDAQLK